MSMKLVVTTAAVLAVLAGTALAGEYDNTHAKSRVGRDVQKTPVAASVYGAGLAGARASYGRSYDFEGWPTDYLVERFGDRQMQGR
jgi:hypothetical protein